jgi:hypothetical protein
VVFPITLFTSAVAQLQFVLCPPARPGQGEAAVRRAAWGRGLGHPAPPPAAAQAPPGRLARPAAPPMPLPPPPHTPPPHTQLLWPWYCKGHSMIANFIRSLITAWLPALLLNAWLVLVLPRLVYLLVQVGGGCH